MSTSSSTDTRWPFSTTTGRAAARHGPETLEERLDRGDHHAGWPGLAPARESPQQPQPSAHGGDVRAHPLERQGLPGREQLDLRHLVIHTRGSPESGPGEHPEVVGQLLGGCRRGGHHQYRPAVAQPQEAGDHEGLGRGGHGQGGAGRAHDPGHGRVVAQQAWQRAQRGHRGQGTGTVLASWIRSDDIEAEEPRSRRRGASGRRKGKAVADAQQRDQWRLGSQRKRRATSHRAAAAQMARTTRSPGRRPEAGPLSNVLTRATTR